MIKILMIYKTCYPETKGGLEQVIRVLAKSCQQFGIETKILVLGSTDKSYKYENSEVILCKRNFEISSNGFSFSLFKKFNELKKWADILHFQYPWPTGDLLSFMCKDKPQIVTYQSDIVRQKFLKFLYKPVEYFFLKKMNYIVATSPQYAVTSPNLIAHRDKVRIIPLAIDANDYVPSTASLHARWKERVGSNFFLFVGVLRYYKGLEFLLKAAEINKLPVVIAGDGPLRRKLELIIHEKNLTNVKLIGFVTEQDKNALLGLCKAFVFPSHLRSEAFGVSLLEAQVYSKPLITSEVGSGSSYVNKHGETGFVTKAGDFQAISDAMSKINADDALSIKFGQAGRARFEKLFSAEKQAKAYYNLYSKMLKL